MIDGVSPVPARCESVLQRAQAAFPRLTDALKARNRLNPTHTPDVAERLLREYEAADAQWHAAMSDLQALLRELRADGTTRFFASERAAEHFGDDE